MIKRNSLTCLYLSLFISNHNHLRLYSSVIFKNVFRLVLQIFLYKEAFESETDLINHLAKPTRRCVTSKFARPGSSVVSVTDSWPGGCEFDPRVRRTFFLAYFRLSPLQKHVRKVVGVLVLVWGSQETHMRHHDMTLAVKVALNPNTTNQLSNLQNLGELENKTKNASVVFLICVFYSFLLLVRIAWDPAFLVVVSSGNSLRNRSLELKSCAKRQVPSLWCTGVRVMTNFSTYTMYWLIPTQWHLLTGLGKKPFENIVGKGEIACTSNFSFSHNIFYSIKDRNYHFCYI